MGGSCSMPLAAHAVWKGGANAVSMLEINAAWGEPELPGEDELGNEKGATASPALVRAGLSAAVTDLQQATALGEQVAAILVERGAQSLRRAT